MLKILNYYINLSYSYRFMLLFITNDFLTNIKDKIWL